MWGAEVNHIAVERIREIDIHSQLGQSFRGLRHPVAARLREIAGRFNRFGHLLDPDAFPLQKVLPGLVVTALSRVFRQSRVFTVTR